MKKLTEEEIIRNMQPVILVQTLYHIGMFTLPAVSAPWQLVVGRFSIKPNFDLSAFDNSIFMWDLTGKKWKGFQS